MLLLLAACSAPFQAERTYIRTIVNHAQRTIATVDRLKALSASPGLTDPAWEDDVTGEIATVRSLITEAREISAPDAFADVHQRYLRAMDSLESMADTYDRAIAAKNNQTLQEALRLADEARTRINEARQRINEVQQQQAQ